jgi:hypothetical protein
MKKFLSIIATSVLVAGIATTTVSADPAKGQKLYLKKLKKACGINGAKMSAKHTQDEWEKLKEEGKLEDEIKKICPNVKDVKDKYLDDLFDFFYEYGSDSGNVPSC